MTLEPPPTNDRNIIRIMGIVILVIVVATASAGGAVLIARRSGVHLTLPLPAASTPATTTLVARRAVELRSGAAPDTAIVTRLSAGTGVEALGRSLDGTWLAVRLQSAPDVVGWVPADAVDGLREVNRLPVIANSGTLATPPSSPASTVDLPDLRIDAAASRNNRLVAVVVNDGPGDLPTPILVAVNDGTPVRIETKAGEPLRAGERIEAIVPGEYVQLRARVSLRVQTEPASRETNTDNNGWSGIVEPDQPNNLGIARAVADGADRHLLVTVTNDSRIPIRGSITLTVREALPSTTLLGREVRDVALEADGAIDIPFADIRPVDLTRIAVRLSTDAIHDAVLADDSFPR
ncbi:MAG: SH3 domain-containing protein [Dehalococcoidia bacterium]